MRFSLGLLAMMWLHHWALWAWTAHSRGFSLLLGLDRWDAAHFSRIVTEGYVAPLYAFLPLYPGTVWAVRALLGGTLPPQLVGTFASSAALLLFVIWVSARIQRNEASPLLPASRWAWFVFLYSPASYALHSHHSEGLFLLLSFGALLLAWEERLWPAVMLATFTLWCRNQGVFVALTTLLLLTRGELLWRERLRRVAVCGGWFAGAYLGLLVFEAYVSGGDLLAHLHAQQQWNHVDTVWGMVRGLWFGNPWQKEPPSLFMWLRNVFAAVLLWASLRSFRRSPPVALYGALSLLVMLPQGDFGNAYRFGAVLFPALFGLGDALSRRPVWLRWTCALFLLWLNHQTAHAYLLSRWAY
ncbi:MAG: mannosyltransferase family protein [Myxococcota bacterium]